MAGWPPVAQEIQPPLLLSLAGLVGPVEGVAGFEDPACASYSVACWYRLLERVGAGVLGAGVVWTWRLVLVVPAFPGESRVEVGWRGGG